MTASELTQGVVRRTLWVVLAASVAGGWLGGAGGGLGVLAGGVLAIASFRLLASRVTALRAAPGLAVVPWSLLAAVRFAAVSGVAAALFATGWAHPVAWLAGYTALPLAVVLQGLRLARAESRA